MKDENYKRYALKSIRRAMAEGNKRKYNGYKEKSERVCFYCGKSYAERHEVFHGTALRKLSLKMGFQIDMCNDHHLEFHAHTDWGEQELLKWQRIYQMVYMALKIKEGLTREKALDEWMIMIGQNYIKELTPP